MRLMKSHEMKPFWQMIEYPYEFVRGMVVGFRGERMREYAVCEDLKRGCGQMQGVTNVQRGSTGINIAKSHNFKPLVRFTELLNRKRQREQSMRSRKRELKHDGLYGCSNEGSGELLCEKLRELASWELVRKNPTHLQGGLHVLSMIGGASPSLLIGISANDDFENILEVRIVVLLGLFSHNSGHLALLPFKS